MQVTYLAVVLVSSFLYRSEGRLLREEVLVVEEKSTSSESATTCEIHSNPSLHLIMDRVCEICHEMISHSQPNTRAQCRSNCFRNSQFRSCLKMFSPRRATRNSRS